MYSRIFHNLGAYATRYRLNGAVRCDVGIGDREREVSTETIGVSEMSERGVRHINNQLTVDLFNCRKIFFRRHRSIENNNLCVKQKVLKSVFIPQQCLRVDLLCFLFIESHRKLLNSIMMQEGDD